MPISAMLERLEISRATFKRDLAYLRDRLNAPIVWDRFGGGYRFEPQRRAGAGQAGPKHAGPKHPGPKHPGPTHQRPGLWFNSSEAYALLAMQQSSRKSTPASWPARSNPWRCACARCSAAAATTSPRSRSASSSCRWARGAPTRNTSATSPAPCSPGAPITRQRRSHRPPDLVAAPGELPRQHFPSRAPMWNRSPMKTRKPGTRNKRAPSKPTAATCSPSRITTTPSW